MRILTTDWFVAPISVRLSTVYFKMSQNEDVKIEDVTN